MSLRSKCQLSNKHCYFILLVFVLCVILINLQDDLKITGFRDYSEFWSEDLFYQTPDLDLVVTQLWQDIEPLYRQLHAYVRRKLREYYGSDVIGSDGTIPAHLLGIVCRM